MLVQTMYGELHSQQLIYCRVRPIVVFVDCQMFNERQGKQTSQQARTANNTEHSIAQHSTAQQSTAPHIVPQHSKAQKSTAAARRTHEQAQQASTKTTQVSKHSKQAKQTASAYTRGMPTSRPRHMYSM